MDMPSEIVRPVCHTAIPATAYFCSNCGKPLKDSPPSALLSKQITVYLVSVFLPPFGLFYVWKYLKQSDRKLRIIGIAALILTVLSILAALWIANEINNLVGQSIDQLNNLGF